MIALTTTVALALTACGQGANPAGNDDPTVPVPTIETSDDQVTIRYAWWGSDSRHQLNATLIEAFTEEYPHINIVPDFAEFSNYWDKLATQTAGGDVPDVLMQEERYLREYAGNGVLADLSDYDIATDRIDEALLGSGVFDDGLWGIPTGANVWAIMIDPVIFEEAGVEIPDDTTWTWAEYRSTMQAISDNTGEGIYGTKDFGFIEAPLNVWLRQHGQSLWSEDGTIGFEPELLAELWEHSLTMIETGAAPPATLAHERDSGGPEQSMIATNESAAASYWNSQLQSLTTASGRELELLQMPGETEFERSGMFLKPAMAISMSASTPHPEEAALFIDWMINSEEAGEIILSDRGLPANLDVRNAISGAMPEADQKSAEFMERVIDSVVDAPPPPPPGAGAVAGVLREINEAVMFGHLTPQEGAERFVAEATSLTVPG